MRGNEHNLKRMFSVMVAGMKQIFAFVAITLVATDCFAGDEKPKLMPLPPIAPGLQLSRLFNDHMVLQRETKVKVWGWAAAGEKVAVEFAGQTKSATTAADGSWLVALDAMAANATGRTLTVRSIRSSEIWPIRNMSFRGAAFYLGENNSLTEPISMFEPTYRAVIASWRQTFSYPAMPFLTVQISAGDSEKRVYQPGACNLIQEAQFRIHRTTPHTGFVVTADDLHTDFHVLRKQSHGERAMRWAMAEVYAKSLPSAKTTPTWGSPAFKSVVTKGNKLILNFDVMSGDELKLNGVPAGFVVAGEDKQFVEAQAELVDKTTVAVWSDKVDKPVSARFAWSSRPYINLWTASGLPVSPFRTDD